MNQVMRRLRLQLLGCHGRRAYVVSVDLVNTALDGLLADAFLPGL